MSIASPEVFDELVRSGVRGRLTVVVGAGASRDAGLPDWVELVRRVVGAAVDQARARGDAAVIDDLGPPEDLGRRPEVDRLRMTLAQQVLGKERYYETLASIFEVAGTPTSTHKALARLPGTTFLTTNYDRLLEAAILEASGRSPTVVLPDDLEGLASLDQGHILKLHGDIGRPESVVLTQGGYQRVRYELGPGWKKVVESLLRPPGLILLMGFSYSDPDVEEVVSGFQAAFGGVGKPIWLERDAPLARAKAEDLGLRLAAVTNFAELPGWIEELGDAIRRGQREGAWTLVVDDLAPQLGAAQASHQRWLDEAKAAWDAGDWTRAEDLYRTLIANVEAAAATEPAPNRLRRLLARARIGASASAANLQDEERAVAYLEPLIGTQLDPELRALLALNLVSVGRVREASRVLRTDAAPDEEGHADLLRAETLERKARRLMELREGRIPLDLDSADDGTLLALAQAHLVGRDLEAASRVALDVAGRADDELLMLVATGEVLVQVLVQIESGAEVASTVPLDRRAELLHTAERVLLTARAMVAPTGRIRAAIEHAAARFYSVTQEHAFQEEAVAWLREHDRELVWDTHVPEQAVALATQGNLTEAERLLAPGRDRAGRAIVRSMLLADTGHIDEAVEELRDGLLTNPDTPSLALRLADLLTRQGRWNEAYEPAKLAYELLSTRRAAFILAATHLNVGRTRDAWSLVQDDSAWGRWLQPASAEKRAGIELQRLRGLVAMELCEYAAAAEAWSIALELDPDRLQLRVALAWARLAAGEHTVAADLAVDIVQAVVERPDALEVPDLFRCFAILKGQLPAQRAREALTALARHLALMKGDLAAAGLHLEIQATLGFPRDGGRPELGELVRAGVVTLLPTDQATAISLRHVRSIDAALDLYDRSLLSFQGMCALLRRDAASMFELLRANGHPLRTARGSGPIGGSLTGTSVFVDHLSLLVLQALGELGTVDSVLGPSGRWMVDEATWTEAADSVVRLTGLAQPVALADARRAYDRIVGEPRATKRARPPSPPKDWPDEAAIAIESGGTAIATSGLTPALGLADLAAVLKASGLAPQSNLARLGVEPRSEPVALRPPLVPDFLVLSRLHEADLLDAFFALGQPVVLSERVTWAFERDISELDLAVRAADRARDLHRWLGGSTPAAAWSA